MNGTRNLTLLVGLAAIWAVGQCVSAQPLGPASPFIDARAGSLPIIISAPHGGRLAPDSLADRSCPNCLIGPDTGTQEWARELVSALERRTGRAPFRVISLLARAKLDPNREIVEAADGDPHAEAAWEAYHGAIEEARRAVEARFGRGILVDLHGHGHAIARLELGVLLSSAQLATPASTLDELTDDTSLRALAERTGSLSNLLRGPDAFGTLFENEGIPAVPSAGDPFPLPGHPYYTGGYITLRHGSRDGGTIDAIQIEAPLGGLRDTAANIRAFALRTATVLDEYLARNYGLVLAMDRPERPQADAGCLDVRSRPDGIEVRAVQGCDPAEGSKIRVHDVIGRQVAASTWQTGRNLITAAGLAPGVYFVVVDLPRRSLARPYVHLAQVP